MFRCGVSNGSVPQVTHDITRMARGHSQARSLAFFHPGARRKADWWHAAIHRMNHETASIEEGGTSEQPPIDRAAPQLQDTESKPIYFTTKARKMQREKFLIGKIFLAKND